MRHPLRVAIVLASGIAVLVVASLLAVYRASQQVPEFYRLAIHCDAQRREAASKEMLRTATALVNNAQKEGVWEAEFTEEQINGWLAVDLVENHGQALPPEVRDPRVAIHSNGAKIGWRWSGDELSAVFSLDVLLGLAEPNQIALTIRGARAGTVPLPLGQVLDTVTNAARELNLQLTWKKSGGHPVALITIPAPDSEEMKMIVVETIELRQGALYLAGKTIPGEEWSATRDWSDFLDQIGEHPRQIGAPAEASTAPRSSPSIQAARRPANEDQSDASRKLQ
jgi:hypothetical protein